MLLYYSWAESVWKNHAQLDSSNASPCPPHPELLLFTLKTTHSGKKSSSSPSHSTDEEMEAQGCGGTCPKEPRKLVADAVSQPIPYFCLFVTIPCPQECVLSPF